MVTGGGFGRPTPQQNMSPFISATGRHGPNFSTTVSFSTAVIVLRSIRLELSGVDSESQGVDNDFESIG